MGGSPARLSVDERPPSVSLECRPDSGGRPWSSLKRSALLLAKALCSCADAACAPGVSGSADSFSGPSANLTSEPAVAGLQSHRDHEHRI